MGLDDALLRAPTGERRRFDASTGALVGSRCTACGGAAWPGRAVCHRCGSASVEERVFAGPAELQSYTEVMVARPGIEPPYLLAQVRLADGPIVFGRVVGLREPVELPCFVTVRLGRDETGGPSYWFEPVEIHEPTESESETVEQSEPVTTANDGEVPIRRSYADYDSAALHRWAAERTAAPGPYRPRFMVYSGLGTPELTAERLALLQGLGAESFLLAADLPSQLGFDPDHELAFAQVGRAGVSCTTLDDFAIICSRLDLGRVESIGLLANSIGHIGLAMVDCVLRDAAARHVALVMQNDPLKEFTARGTEIFTPEQSVRIACDCVAYAIDERLPGAAITVCSNHLDVAGAGPVLALAVAFADALAYVDELARRGYAVADVLGSMMFFLNERSDLFVTASLFRTARVLWADLVQERYGLPVVDQPVTRLMGYAHGLESATEPLVNVPRVTLSVLGAMLGGVDYLCATGYDEALRIPSADAAALALRTMQVVGYEHGATATLDPLQGSRKLAAIDSLLADEVGDELRRIEELGGALGVLRDGYVAARIDERRGTPQRQLESGERAMVGSNVYRCPTGGELFAGRSAGELDFAAVEEAASARVREHRARRDTPAVEGSLLAVEEAAASTANLVPPTVVALRAGATAQELVAATRRGFER